MREVLGGTLPGCRARSGHLSPALAHRLGCRSLPARAARDGLGCGESLLGARQGAARVRGREGVPGPRRSHAGPCAHVSGRADGRPGDGGYVGLLSRKEAAAAAGVRGASLGARGAAHSGWLLRPQYTVHSPRQQHQNLAHPHTHPRAGPQNPLRRPAPTRTAPHQRSSGGPSRDRSRSRSLGRRCTSTRRVDISERAGSRARFERGEAPLSEASLSETSLSEASLSETSLSET